MPNEKQMPKNHFKSVIRMIKSAPLDKVKFMRNATYNHLHRLYAKRDVTKSWTGIPKGSDQTDPMSIIKWMETVTVEDKKAIEQIICIDATACKRMS